MTYPIEIANIPKASEPRVRYIKEFGRKTFNRKAPSNSAIKKVIAIPDHHSPKRQTALPNRFQPNIGSINKVGSFLPS